MILKYWSRKLLQYLKRLAFQASLDHLLVDKSTSIIGAQVLTAIAKIRTIKNLELLYCPKLK